MKSLDMPIVITPTLTLPHQRGRGNPGFTDENYLVSEPMLTARASVRAASNNRLLNQKLPSEVFVQDERTFPQSRDFDERCLPQNLPDSNSLLESKYK